MLKMRNKKGIATRKNLSALIWLGPQQSFFGSSRSFQYLVRNWNIEISFWTHLTCSGLRCDSPHIWNYLCKLSETKCLINPIRSLCGNMLPGFQKPQTWKVFFLTFSLLEIIVAPWALKFWDFSLICSSGRI